MGTISDYSSADTIARSKRGQASYSGGAKPIVASQSTTPTPNFGQWAKNFGSQVGSLATKGLLKTGEFIANTPKYTYEGIKPFLDATAKVVTGNLNADNRQIESQRTQLDTMLNNAVVSYKSGKMSKDNYNKVLQEYGKSNQDLAKSAIDVEAQIAKQTHDIPVSAATTAATILLGGRLQLDSTPTAALRRTATAAGTTEAKNTVINSIIDQNATKLEKAFTTIPAVRDLLSRNLQYLGRREAQQLMGETTSQYVAREGKALAINMILKRPILYETNIQGAQEVYDKMIQGNYGDAAKQAAWLGTQMLKGGPLGASLSGLSWLKNKATKLSYGQGSFIDEISRQIGTKQSTQVADYLTNLKTNDPEKFKEAERVLRIVQEANLQMANNDAAQAANRVLQHWDEYGIQLDKVTPEKVVGLLKNWSDAHELKNALIKGGKIPGVAKNEVDKFVVVRWDVAARKALADKLSEAGDDIQKQVDAYNTWRLAPGNAAGQNFILTNKIESILSKGLTGDELAQQVKDLSAASVMSKNIPDKYKAQFAKLGFAVAEPSEATKLTQKITPSVDYNDTRKLVTAIQNGDKEIFDIAQAPQPELNTAARTLESFGVSPVESNQVANRVLAQQVVADIDTAMAKQIGFSTNPNADTPEAGRYILSKLKQYIEDKQPSKIGNLFVANSAVGPAISDIRQLTTKEIMEALSVTSEQAKAISKAVVNAYAKVPMEYRGLGDKIVDNLYKFNPLQKYYSRIQSALRYTYNPFFRTQESFETMALSKAQARTPLWMMTKDELNNGAKILDEAGIFKTGLSGEAAQDLVLGRITANITPGQKRNLAGLAMSMAKSRNMTLQQMLEKHPQDVEDALRVVVQYPNRGILNSSLARTLNVAFFPMRYNAKVTKLSAEILAKEAPSVQLAVINSLFNLRDWLKSDEGIKWQSANNEAIQVFNWLTPVNSIEYGIQRLTRKPNSIGELGSLGGLPLGFITQMLDSQGIINLNTPYVAPKTGDVFPKYIPETTKARAATALGDLLNSMFTYPGRVLGLPGKNATINQIVRQFIDTHGTDFERQIQTDRLTPLQQNWIRVLKGDTSQEAIDALYNSAAPGQFNWYTIPPLDLPIRTPYQQTQPVQQRTGLPKKASKGKKVKPTALPIA